jgi:antitoxin HicB
LATFYVYPVSIRKGRDGRYLARFPDVPEALTDGATKAEAYLEAKDALAEALMSRMADKEDIPAPSEPRGRLLPVALDPTVALKVALYDAVREQGLTIADLARLLGVDHKEARRLLDPHHVSKLPRLRQALASTGYEIFVGVRKASETSTAAGETAKIGKSATAKSARAAVTKKTAPRARATKSTVVA